jgi:hypothetical protein
LRQLNPADRLGQAAPCPVPEAGRQHSGPMAIKLRPLGQQVSASFHNEWQHLALHILSYVMHTFYGVF